MHDENCLFCKIIKGKIPSYKIYEDDKTYAFLDIAKDAIGHTVIVPKNHCSNILDANSEDLLAVLNAVQKISNHYINDCGYDGCNVLNNCNEAAGQSIMHLHFHIIPRKKNDDALEYKMSFKHEKTLEEVHQELKL